MTGYELNYIGVLISAIVGFFIGMLWYSPLLFGKVWMKLSKISKKDIEKSKKKGMGKSMITGFLGVLLTAGMLSFFVDMSGAATILEGAQIAFHIWLGFVATVLLNSVLWEGKPFKLYILNIAHYFVALIVMGAILAMWI
jgi:hypothetical protein